MQLNKVTPILLFFLILSFSLSCQKQVAYPIKVRRINDKVIVCSCYSSNVAAIATRKGLVIIDTNRSPGIMKEMKEIIKKELGRGDFWRVINTHGHWDHASGNQAFPESLIIGHDHCPLFMTHNPATALTVQWSLDQRLSTSRKRLEGLDPRSGAARVLAADIANLEMLIRDLKENYTATPPGRTFTDSMKLDAGDLTLELFYCGNAHTNNDILVFIPEQRMLFSGDLFTGRSSFSFGVNVINDIPRVLAAVDRVLLDASGVQCAVTGHGQSDLSGSDLRDLRKMLQEQYRELDSARSAALVLKKLLQDHDPDTAVKKFRAFRKGAGRRCDLAENEFSLLAWQFLWAGSVEKAIGAFRTMVDEFPASALACDNLAEAFMQNGDIDSAAVYYRRSLQLYPGNINAQEILKLLRK